MLMTLPRRLTSAPDRSDSSSSNVDCGPERAISTAVLSTSRLAVDTASAAARAMVKRPRGDEPHQTTIVPPDPDRYSKRMSSTATTNFLGVGAHWERLSSQTEAGSQIEPFSGFMSPSGIESSCHCPSAILGSY